MSEQLLFYYLAGVPLLGIAAQWLAWRFRLPSILLLLGIGILLGTYIHPDELLAELAGSDSSIGPKILFPIVTLSVAVILFEGGLSLRFSELKEAGRGVLRLVVVGALISWVLTMLAAWWLLELNPRVALLIGAVLVVTGPTVVAPMLRQIRPKRRVSLIVKWEGIVIDPIGAVLAVFVFEFVFAEAGHANLQDMVLMLLGTATTGAALGGLAAGLLILFVKKYWIPDFLHGVVFLAVALGVFALSNAIKEESGLITVTVLGVILANQKTVPIHHVVEFKEHLRVFLISCLFIVLGSRLRISDVLELGWRGAAFLAVMIAVVRPASVYLSTLRTRLSIEERTFLAFLAPRGIVAAAVASVFALKLATLAGAEPSLAEFAQQADDLVPITFLVIVGTVFVYGLTAAPLARRLQLSDSNPQGLLLAGAEPWVREIAVTLQESGQEVLLVDTNYAHVAAAQMAGVPAECASILSEHVREELDLGGIGRLLALTSNDEVNALAVREYAHLFGRENVYQLPPWDHDSGRRTSIAEHLRGRLLFEEGLHHDELWQRFEAGEIVKKTKLSDEFTFEQFNEMYPDANVLFVLSDTGKLTVCTVDQVIAAKSGSTVVALVKPPPQAEST